MTLLLTFSLAQAQDLHIYMSASSEVVGPGDRTTYTVTATNTGTADLLNVSVEIQMPDHIANFWSGYIPELSCSSGNYCTPETKATWTVGTLSPGESRSLYYIVQIRDDAPETTILSSAIASASNSNDVSTTLNVSIDPTPLLRLSIAPDPGPVVAGELHTYTLTYGNIGSSSPSGVVMTMAIPDGASFISATNGGTLNEGVVTWDIGLLGAAGGGSVQLTIQVDESLPDGNVLEASATLDPGVATEYTVTSSVVTSIRRGSPLKLKYSVNQSVLGPGDLLRYTLTATNTGPVDLLDLNARVLLPGSISNFWEGYVPDFNCVDGNYCNSAEYGNWNIGSLAPGESRSLYFVTNISGNTVPGEILRSLLTAHGSNAEQVTAALDLQVDPSPLLRLSIVPEAGPAVPGEPFTYTLTFSNIGDQSPENVILSMPIPDGTQFSSASHGGTLNEGTVSWNIGLLGVAGSKQVQLTVIPDANLQDGHLIEATAAIDPGMTTEHTIHSSAITPVHGPSPLHLRYAINQNTLAAGDQLIMSLTASNTGPVDLLNINTRILLPGSIQYFWHPTIPNFSCVSSNYCTPSEYGIWSIETLKPGESRTMTFSTRISDNAVPGEVLRSILTASASNAKQVQAGLDIQVDPSPLLRLNVASDPGPIVAGKPFTYRLHFGNIGSTSPSDAVLTMKVPDEITFASASHHGKLIDNEIHWDLPLLGAGMTGYVNASFIPDANLTDGTLISALASFDSGINNEVVVSSSTVTPIRADKPLALYYDLEPLNPSAGEDVDMFLKVTNNGLTELQNVNVRVLLPNQISQFWAPDIENFACVDGNYCNSREFGIWSVGNLGPGASDSLKIGTTLSNNPTLGEVLRSPVTATVSNTGTNQVSSYDDIVVGTLLNWPPSAATLVVPDNPAELLIGGSENEPPVSPDSTFEVWWNAAQDPDHDAVTYRWQLSDDATFNTMLVDASSNTNGNDTLFTTNFGTLNQILTDLDVKIGESITLYHRIMATDGHYVVSSDTYSITLTRGTIVGVEKQVGLPKHFALHTNYPNPFNPTTNFSFDLPKAVDVQLKVFDITGREVATLVSKQLPAGTYSYNWDAHNLASGIYIYRLTAGSFVDTRKLTLLK